MKNFPQSRSGCSFDEATAGEDFTVRALRRVASRISVAICRWSMLMVATVSVMLGAMGARGTAAWASSTAHRVRPVPSMSCWPSCSGGHGGFGGVPEIVGISPLLASPGQSVTLSGSHFGKFQLTGYVEFSDNNVDCGAPGDPASVRVISWTGSQIRFVVPTLSGPFALPDGTQAAVTVTNSDGSTSAPAPITLDSGVVFPVQVKGGAVPVGDGGEGFMQTALTISSSGLLTAKTHMWDGSPFGETTAFRGFTVVTAYNNTGSPQGQWIGGPWTVDFGHSRTYIWHETVRATALNSLYSVSVVNVDPPTSDRGAIVQWVLDDSSQLYSDAQIVAENS